MTERLELRYVDLATLRRWDRNAKRHDLGALAESITRHGFRDPPAYDPALNGGEGGIVEGNGRGDALSAMQAQGQPAPRGVVVEGGAWLVPVLFGVDAPSQAAAEAYGIAHNNLTMAGGDFTDLDMAGMWEPEGYAALLRSLAEQGEIPVSIDATALDALLAGLAGAPEPGAGGDEFDATPDDGPTRCQLGDLWSIGGVHRLLVGDCTDPANVARLMQGERADMVWTDPPYGVSIGEKNKYLNSIAPANRIEENLENDTLDEPALMEMLRAAFANAAAHCLAGGAWYVAAPAGPLHVLFGQALKERGIWHQTIQWVKNNATFAPLGVDYHWRAEPIFYGWEPGAAHRYYGGRKQDTVWEIDRPQSSPDHPTMKPIELVQRAVENSSQAGNIILDPFLGSGTTMIAAHRTGRRCYGMEIAPRYADVILKRCEAEGLTVERTS